MALPAQAGLLDGARNAFTASLSGIFLSAVKILDPRIIQTNGATYFDLKKPSLTGVAPAALSNSGVSETQQSDDIVITYTTPAPTKKEAVTKTGKTVTISSPRESNFKFSIFNFQSIFNASNNQNDDLEYTDVLAYTNIPEIYDTKNQDKIKIKWLTEGGKEISFQTYDTNNNGKIDYIEWTVPHLSDQTFNIIYISKAFQLDQNKNIVADIYDTVATQDENFATIPTDNYVRVTFEQILDNTNDITIYARSNCGMSETQQSCGASVEVYPVYVDADGNQTEGAKLDLVNDGQNPDFSNIDHNGKYRILLQNLQSPTDIFDLKIVCGVSETQQTNCGGLDIDYIVDPSSTETLRPNAAGDETNILVQFPDSTFHWDKVDEAIADDTSTYIKHSDTSYARDLYNLPDSSGSGTINFVKIYFRFNADRGGSAKPVLKSGSTITEGDIVYYYGSAFTTASQQWTTNPEDSEAWEWADIDALQIGISLLAERNAQATQVYVEVNYTEASGAGIKFNSGIKINSGIKGP